MRSIVVVGASLAGLRAAETLRDEGFEDEVVVVGAEPHLPYNRPPLSKEALGRTGSAAGLQLVSEGALEVTWRLGAVASRLDAWDDRVILSNGETISFDGLVVATGVKARPFEGPGAGLPGVHVLRTVEDAEAIGAALRAAPRMIVVGGGFIGSEVAATARSLGVQVTLVEIERFPLLRALGPQVGEACASLHGDHGVHLRLGVGVVAFEGTDRLERVLLSDGTTLEMDLAVVGLGASPNVHWLRGNGLSLDNGLLCDATLHAIGASHVVGAGDVVCWPHALLGGSHLRIEHWTNAAEQGMVAARNLLHGRKGAESFATVPSFWSDQHGVKIQSVGFPWLAETCHIAAGSVAERRFVAAYGLAGRLIGAVAFGMPGQLGAYRRGVAAGEPYAQAYDHRPQTSTARGLRQRPNVDPAAAAPVLVEAYAPTLGAHKNHGNDGD